MLLVSIFMPSPENRKGPTQPVFDLARCASKEIEIDLLVYGDPGIETPKETRLIFKNIQVRAPKKLPGLSYFFSIRLPRRVYPLQEAIDYAAYDLIWLYQEWLYPEYRKCHPKILVTGMDSSVMLYSRALFRNPLYRPFSMMSKIIRSWVLESGMDSKHRFHAMGHPDLACFRKLNRHCEAFYGAHPLPPCKVKANLGKARGRHLTVAVTGGFSKFYHGSLTHRIIDCFARKERLDGIRWVFLGKGWSFAVNGLQKIGYEAVEEIWVDNYQDFMDAVDIHLVPLQVGAGTKGKVLHSIGSGIVTIGSPYAFENILDDPDSLLVFDSPQDIHSIFSQALSNMDPFQKATKELMVRTRKDFDPAAVGADFWAQIDQYIKA